MSSSRSSSWRRRIRLSPSSSEVQRARKPTSSSAVASIRSYYKRPFSMSMANLPTHRLRALLRLAEALALGGDVAGDLVLVTRQQPAAPHHHLPVHDHRLGPRGRGQRQACQEVLDPCVSEVVDAEAGDVGALAGVERAAIVAAEAFSPAGRRQAPGGPSIQRLRRRLADPGQQESLVRLHRKVRVLVARRAVDPEATARTGAD